MKVLHALFTLCLLLTLRSFGQQEVEQWGRFETVFQHRFSGNPFTEASLSVTFTHADTSMTVNGFYDGNDRFVVRFMPHKTGTWRFISSSKHKALNGKKGSFSCVAPSKGNHGPVKVSEQFHFAYADGAAYYPVGTTAYAWNHMDKGIQATTLQSLKQSGFNKVRMCVFPKNYDLVKEEPPFYPYEKNKGKWITDRFDPKFFQELEQQIDQFNGLGIQTDLIVFHPYDKGRWGFDSLSHADNLRYVEYLTARLSSFRNIWWSMANEWDYVKPKSVDQWKELTKAVHQQDPYRHLLSIHGSTAVYFDYSMPEFTHLSVQDEGPVMYPGGSPLLRQVYGKPVIYDEVGYEGNLTQRWGRHSAEEMTRLMWMGLIGGTYVTHGETYSQKVHSDTIFWAKGGPLRGESWKRAAFLRKILESNPGPLEPADISRDYITATTGKGVWMVYFGKEILDRWTFNLPSKNGSYERPKAGEKYHVELIDTWEMTIQQVDEEFTIADVEDYRHYDQKRKQLRLPQRPYLALRITRLRK